MTRPLFRVCLLLLLLLSGGWRARAVDCNAQVLEAIQGMPEYGTYSASKASFDGLTRAITVHGGSLAIDPLQARPSFCSGATYLVFVRALERLAAQGSLNLEPATLQALVVAGQRDGQGIWGRWNANGPGTARLFSELQLGRNFCEFSEARPGDFMKIFWTDEIGKKERGHSVIYLGSKKVGNPGVHPVLVEQHADARGRPLRLRRKARAEIEDGARHFLAPRAPREHHASRAPSPARTLSSPGC